MLADFEDSQSVQMAGRRGRGATIEVDDELLEILRRTYGIDTDDTEREL